MNDKAQTFAELVLAWRAARNITRVEAARRLGIPYRTLEDWEHGLHAPRGYARRAIEARLRRR
jgi:DNA-binding transcriptional regulator YiaG